jgi:hypothetical protein
LQVPEPQIDPPTLHAAPTAGVAMHLAAPSHLPLVLSHDFGALTVQVVPSGRGWAVQVASALQTPTWQLPTGVLQG